MGALACIVILCAYDLVAFGSVSAISYQYNPDTTQLMKRGLLGVTFPQPSVLYQLLFNLSQGHGLLPLAPVLLGALPGLILMWKRNLKREALLFAAVPLYYLFFNSAYQDWTGGSTYGPRYLSAGLLFLGPPLAISWASGSRRLRALLAVLAIAGFALALIAESTYPMPGKEYTYPLMHLVRGFLSGQVPMTYVYSVPTDASNAGRFLGLHGIWSLTPLFVLWIAAALLVWILMEPRPVFRRALTQLSSLL